MISRCPWCKGNPRREPDPRDFETNEEFREAWQRFDAEPHFCPEMAEAGFEEEAPHGWGPRPEPA